MGGLASPGKKAKLGSVIVFGDGLLKAKIISRFENGNRLVEFYFDGNFYEILDKIGETPLPVLYYKKAGAKRQISDGLFQN
jgi:S-adenosylmethionine:tRNA ribosyltransferase-isomerase